LIFM
jgi:hypothetical protein